MSETKVDIYYYREHNYNQINDISDVKSFNGQGYSRWIICIYNGLGGGTSLLALL
uniref:Uncharacterized protein n=1 Tax=Tetranychus urticae TaxID=32264 RepID=T1K1J3_TETUR